MAREPKDPLIIFLGDGSEFWVRKVRNTTRNGVPMMELSLCPLPDTMNMLGITDNELDRSEYAEGILIRMVPESYIMYCSLNPENERWVSFTNYEGKEIIAKNKPCSSIMKLMEQVKNHEEEITMLNTRLEQQRERMRILVRDSREESENLSAVFGRGKEAGIVIPPEALGLGENLRPKSKKDE